MQYPESVEYLYALGNEIKTVKLGLERVGAVAARMGHPERRFRVVHVAGTNGKGSTCAMIAAGLRAAGFKTGLYTSPHLVEPLERIVVDGESVSREEFAAAFREVHCVAEAMMEAGELDAHPTYFETVTLMAFHVFAARGVEWGVIEVGLGGRLDATNIVQPQLTVITPVDYDHEAWLGKSIEGIAFEKAGILKKGADCVVGAQRAEAAGVIAARALAVGADVVEAWREEMRDLEMYADGSRFVLGDVRVACPLAGEHQAENARTAAIALRELGLRGEQITTGIAGARWPGRLEKVSVAPEIYLDGAHNPSGAAALAAYIRRFHGGRKVGLIYGAMRDKSVDEIAGKLFAVADEVIVTAPDQTRALRPEAILEMCPHDNARTAATLGEAVAMERSCDVLFITGSLYLVGEARPLFVQ